MPPRLTTDCAKNYCNRALIVKVIVENVVTCFLLGHSVVRNPLRSLELKELKIKLKAVFLILSNQVPSFLAGGGYISYL